MRNSHEAAGPIEGLVRVATGEGVTAVVFSVQATRKLEAPHRARLGSGHLEKPDSYPLRKCSTKDQIVATYRENDHLYASLL